MTQNPHPAVPTLQHAEAPGNCLAVDVDQKPIGELACGESLLDVLLPDISLAEACQNDSVGEQRICPRDTGDVMVVGLRLASASSLVSFLYCNQFIWGTEYDTCAGVLFA